MYTIIIFLSLSAHAQMPVMNRVQPRQEAVTAQPAQPVAPVAPSAPVPSKLTNRSELLAIPKFKECWERTEPKSGGPASPPDCSKPRKVGENIDKFEKADPSSLPKDNLELDLGDLRKAVNNGLKHCSTMTDSPVSVGGRMFTRKEICQKANNKMKDLLDKPNVTPQSFMTEMKDKFDFYQYKCTNNSGNVLFTGYYTPMYHGRTKEQGYDSRYRYPIYKKPDDMIIDKKVETICAGQQGEYKKTTSQTMRKNAKGELVPYFTREEIDQGALRDKGLEIGWLEKRWNVHNAQIQGDVSVRGPNGQITVMNYGTANGYKWVGTARAIRCYTGDPNAGGSMEAISKWLDSNQDVADAIEAMDPSYVFMANNGRPPLGVDDTPLTNRATIAVDPGHFPFEVPVLFATSRVSTDGKGNKTGGTQKFQTVALAQDKGGAIKDCRVDTYWNSVDGETIAGSMKFTGSAFVAIPK